MTTRWRPEFDPDHLHFITTTAVNRAHIFRRAVVKRILVDTLHFVSVINGVSLYAFVVMPNHIHAIVQCPQDFPPKDWARAFKAGASQLVVRLYQVEHNESALDFLAATVTRPDKQKYKVWEDGYLPKSIVTPDFLVQKLTYVHNNPVQPHWHLVDVPEAYVWLSARFYLENEPCIIPVQDVRKLLI